MRIRPLVVVAIIALMLAAGCATVTFKRGAGPGSMTADEDACRATSADEAAYGECLRQRGWFMAGKGAGAGSETPAGEPAAPGNPAPEAPSEAAPAPVAEPAAAPRQVQPGAPAPATAASGSSAPTAPKAAPAVAVKATATTAPPKAVDPLTRVDVGSWWKLGGTAAELDRAIAACVDTLGEAHRPNPGATKVTVALRDCLRTAKWFPVGRSGSH